MSLRDRILSVQRALSAIGQRRGLFVSCFDFETVYFSPGFPFALPAGNNGSGFRILDLVADLVQSLELFADEEIEEHDFDSIAANIPFTNSLWKDGPPILDFKGKISISLGTFHYNSDGKVPNVIFPDRRSIEWLEFRNFFMAMQWLSHCVFAALFELKHVVSLPGMQVDHWSRWLIPLEALNNYANLFITRAQEMMFLVSREFHDFSFSSLETYPGPELEDWHTFSHVFGDVDRYLHDLVMKYVGPGGLESSKTTGRLESNFTEFVGQLVSQLTQQQPGPIWFQPRVSAAAVDDPGWVSNVMVARFHYPAIIMFIEINLLVYPLLDEEFRETSIVDKTYLHLYLHPSPHSFREVITKNTMRYWRFSCTSNKPWYSMPPITDIEKEQNIIFTGAYYKVFFELCQNVAALRKSSLLFCRAIAEKFAATLPVLKELFIKHQLYWQLLGPSILRENARKDAAYDHAVMRHKHTGYYQVHDSYYVKNPQTGKGSFVKRTYEERLALEAERDQKIQDLKDAATAKHERIRDLHMKELFPREYERQQRIELERLEVERKNQAQQARRSWRPQINMDDDDSDDDVPRDDEDGEYVFNYE